MKKVGFVSGHHEQSSFLKVFTVNSVITVISQINTDTTENNWLNEIRFATKSSSPTMITPIIVTSLRLVGPCCALILVDQKMLTSTNYSTCYGTLSLVMEITVITVKTFEKTRISIEIDRVDSIL